jgi:hypothetical protein
VRRKPQVGGIEVGCLQVSLDGIGDGHDAASTRQIWQGHARVGAELALNFTLVSHEERPSRLAGRRWRRRDLLGHGTCRALRSVCAGWGITASPILVVWPPWTGAAGGCGRRALQPAGIGREAATNDLKARQGTMKVMHNRPPGAPAHPPKLRLSASCAANGSAA